MTAILSLERHALSSWHRQLAALGLAWLVLLGLFIADVADIVTIWWNSSTFNHCLLIGPIIAWLVWQRLPELRQLEPSAWWAGLAPIAAGGFAWLLGEAAGIAFARHLGLVLILQGAAMACLGPAVSRGLAFPLFYAFFMVPFGEELVPAMQTVTAEISMILLALVGIPAHLEGVFITTPTGYFEVAEACAGVKFLIAMIAFGALVANVCFRSWRRRAAFMAAAILIPILANGIRAWGTILIAHHSGIEFAVGFDHVIYGGIFFAIVIALILAAGWRYFDRPAGEPWFDPKALTTPPSTASPLLVLGACLALAALPLAWSGAVSAAGTAELPGDFGLPAIDGWSEVETDNEWRPHFAGADRRHFGRYRDRQGREVDLAIIVFARQSEGRELVGYGQGAVDPDGSWAWTADGASPPGGRAERIASRGLVREVVSFYRVGNALTGSVMGVKLETLKTRLLGGPQRAVAILVSARAPAAGVSARPAIDDFLRSLGPVEALADRAAGLEL